MSDKHSVCKATSTGRTKQKNEHLALLTHLDGFKTLVRHVCQQPADEVDRVLGGGRLEDAAPGVSSDLREAELLVVRVHTFQLFLRGRAQNLQPIK